MCDRGRVFPLTKFFSWILGGDPWHPNLGVGCLMWRGPCGEPASQCLRQKRGMASSGWAISVLSLMPFVIWNHCRESRAWELCAFCKENFQGSWMKTYSAAVLILLTLAVVIHLSFRAGTRNSLKWHEAKNEAALLSAWLTYARRAFEMHKAFLLW